jgi:hypothetical protein
MVGIVICARVEAFDDALYENSVCQGTAEYGLADLADDSHGNAREPFEYSVKAVNFRICPRH